MEKKRYQTSCALNLCRSLRYQFQETVPSSSVEKKMKAIITALALCCLLNMYGIVFVSAEPITRTISGGGTVSFTSPGFLRRGTQLNLKFEELTLTGRVSIEGTNFSQEFSSSGGKIDAGPFNVTLAPGKYTLTETYSGDAVVKIDPLPNLPLPIEGVTLNRSPSVSEPTTYEITINTTVSDLKAKIEGSFAGEKEIPGVIGSTVSMQVVNENDIEKGETIKISGRFTLTLVSNTQIRVGDKIKAEITVTPNELLDGSKKLQFSVGQEINVAMKVTNQSGVQLKAKAPRLEVSCGKIINGPVPIEATLDQVSVTFKWIVRASDPCEFSFKGQASGDSTKPPEQQFVSNVAVSEKVTIQKPLPLTAAMTVLRKDNRTPIGQIQPGQKFLVQLTVTNEGEATAFEVQPTFKVEPEGSTTILRTPEPGGVSIPGKDAKTFEWELRANPNREAGAIDLIASAQGKDINRKAAQSNEVKKTVTLKLIELSIRFGKSPERVSEGQEGSVEVIVDNVGKENAIGIKSQLSPFQRDGSESRLITLSPEDGAKDIPVGGSPQTYHWKYKAQEGSKGEYFFRASVIDDFISADAKEAPFTVEIPPKLIVKSVQFQPLLFSEESTVQSDLNQGGLSEGFRRAFESRGILFSQNVTVSPIEGNTWQITDVANQRTYFVRKETDQLNVYTPPADEATISEGQPFHVIVKVKNDGQATAADVTVNLNSSAPEKVGDVTPPPQKMPKAILGQGEEEFIFRYNASTNQGGSVLTFTATPTGQDKNYIDQGINKTIESLQSKTSEKLTIQTPANLATQLILLDAKGSEANRILAGDPFTLKLDVKNDGQARARELNIILEPDTLDIGIALIKSDSIPQTIGGDSAETFKWVYQTDPAKSRKQRVTFKATIRWQDENSYQKSTLTPDILVDIRYKELIVTGIRVKSPKDADFQKNTQITEGQTFDVEMVVENTGSVDAQSVKPIVEISPANAKITPPTPQPERADIKTGKPPENRQTYLWEKYQTATGSSGEYTFTGRAEGADIVARSFSPPDVKLLIQTLPKLVIEKIEFSQTLNGARSNTLTISAGQDFYAIVTVKNEGEQTFTAKAVNVLADLMPSEDKKVEIRRSSQEIPGGGQEILGGGRGEFPFQYKTTRGVSESKLTFTATASGKDGNSKQSVSADAQTSDTVWIQRPAQLVIESVQFKKKEDTDRLENWKNTLTISEGQSFNVRVTVSNNGEAAADGVSVKLTPNPDGKVKPDKLPDPQDLPGVPVPQEPPGHHFDFEYSTQIGQSASELTFTATATGKDHHSGNPVSDQKTSGQVQIQRPAQLVIKSIQFKKKEDKDQPENWLDTLTISEGQSFNVRVRVCNSGQAAADTVSVELLQLPGVNPKSVPALQNIPGTQAPDKISCMNFDFEYSTQKGQSASVLTFTATATGKDHPSQTEVSSKPVGSQAVTIQTQPALAPKLQVLNESGKTLTQITAGQKIIIALTITNTGQATAQQVKPELTIQIDDKELINLQTDPKIIKGISSETIVPPWEYQTKSADAGQTAKFSVTITGFDANYPGETDQAKIEPASDMLSRPLVKSAALDVAIHSMSAEKDASRTQLTAGENIRIEITVTNNGEETARNVKLTVTPDPSNLVGKPSEPQPILLGEIDKSTPKQTITYPTLSTIDEEREITFTATATGDGGNTGKPVPEGKKTSDQKITLLPIRNLEVTNIKVTDVDGNSLTVIGINQFLNVVVELKTTGAPLRITPSETDLNISKDKPPQYEIVKIPSQQTVETNTPLTITYRVRTTDRIPESGKKKISLTTLEIQPEHPVEGKPSLVSSKTAEIAVQKEQPQLKTAIFLDVNTDGEVNKGDQLVLTFDLPVEVKSGKTLSPDDLVLFPPGGLFSLGANVSVTLSRDGKKIFIQFNQGELNLPPQGIEDDYKTGNGIGIGISPKTNLIGSGNKNPPDPTLVVDIDFEDTEPPEVLPLSESRVSVSATPEISFLIKNDQKGLDSALAHLEEFEYILDRQTLLKIPEDIIVQKEEKLGKEFILIVKFQKPLLEGPHTLTIIVKDSKGERLLFSLGSSFQSDLDGQKISNELRQEFKNNQAPLSPNPLISIKEKDTRWSITDLDNKQYIVRKEEGKLNIYDKKIAQQSVTFTVTQAAIASLVTFPNPFAPRKGEVATIRYELNNNNTQTVTLNIYDIAGRLVYFLEKTDSHPGVNRAQWTGRTQGEGDFVAAGVYTLELIAAGTKPKYWRIVVGPSIRR